MNVDKSKLYLREERMDLEIVRRMRMGCRGEKRGGENLMRGEKRILRKERRRWRREEEEVEKKEEERRE